MLEDPRAVCLGNEPVRAGGDPVGRVTSGGQGHRVGKSIAYALLPAEISRRARVEVAVFGQSIAAEVSAEPLYDPASDRVRA